MKAQYGILRFAKYKGPEIGHIEAHNERKKERYSSNPDVDTGRSQYNFHLAKPQRKYRAEAERQIAGAGCRTRSDSVRIVEALVTASPEFFHGKTSAEIREYFTDALDFIKAHQNERTIVSAVVHMDEKTPHMHLTFVPLTEDGRLSAKDIVGNKKKLTWWQDEFWKTMVKKYPELERGESVAKTGRDHIPPRVFKQMTCLTKQKEKIDTLLADANFFNSKAKIDEVTKLLDKYIPAVAKMDTELKKYRAGFTKISQEHGALVHENERLEQALDDRQHDSIVKKMEDLQLRRDYDAAVSLLKRIPPEILQAYSGRSDRSNRRKHDLEI